MENKIIHGDCLEEMKKLPDNSVDAIVTDPPYGLSFMGKKWDYEVPNVDVWKEAFRVLKPGAYLLSFFGTRTYHRGVVNIEDAGFEIRDCIMWLYGSGFPKSLNIGKQVDKIQGNEREVVGVSKNEKDFRDVGKKVKEEIGIDKLSFGTIENAERKELEITKGNSGWEGWGTALKPAVELIVVARKPLSEKNVALNCLKWGTGGINIDACRIEHNEELKQTNRQPRNSEQTFSDKSCGFKSENQIIASANPQGRFPANIILDEEAGKMLDEQAPQTGAIVKVTGQEPSAFKKNEIYNDYSMINKKASSPRDKIGGASRFFYCAKASKSERNFGCEELDDKKTDDGPSVVSDRPHQRGKTQRKNNHPTVKPIKLMEYLVKLVSKENSVVLDPFLGSGTTAIACLKLNRRFIGIEKEGDYVKICEARINAWEEKLK